MDERKTTMKIDNTPVNPAGVRETAQTSSAAHMAGKVQAPDREDDAPFSVEISAAAEEKANELSDEDQARRERVAAIRAQLAAGSYSISGKDVAEKILDAIKG